VKNTGLGIEPDFHKRIFDRFVSAEKEYTKSSSYTGLGLVISKGLIELLGVELY